MLIEAAVFGCDDPLLEVVRDLGKGDEFFAMHTRFQCFPEVEHIVHFFLGGEELLRPVDGAFCVRLRRPCFDAALLGLCGGKTRDQCPDGIRDLRQDAFLFGGLCVLRRALLDGMWSDRFMYDVLRELAA